MIAERMTDETVEMKFTEFIIEQSQKEFDVESVWINIFGNPINDMNQFVIYTYKKDDDGK